MDATNTTNALSTDTEASLIILIAASELYISARDTYLNASAQVKKELVALGFDLDNDDDMDDDMDDELDTAESALNDKYKIYALSTDFASSTNTLKDTYIATLESADVSNATITSVKRCIGRTEFDKIAACAIRVK